MPGTEFSQLRLDPWVASSLLQKAIRRGEVALARHAARSLYQHRGKGIWRRLTSIAFEDVGIGAPELVAELASFATSSDLRAIVATDIDLINELVGRLAAAPKDRSADYLFCSAIKLPTSLQHRATLVGASPAELVSIAADPTVELIRRAVASLLACTVNGEGKTASVSSSLAQLVASFHDLWPSPLHQAAERAASLRCDAIVLMVPLLWSVACQEEMIVEIPPLPATAHAGKMPLYAFDMHTQRGKQAIARFVEGNRSVQKVIAVHAPGAIARDVAAVAAFYADGAPVARRVLWSQSWPLEHMGIAADMTAVGCPEAGIAPILECVRSNIQDLDRVRRELTMRIAK